MPGSDIIRAARKKARKSIKKMRIRLGRLVRKINRKLKAYPKRLFILPQKP